MDAVGGKGELVKPFHREFFDYPINLSFKPNPAPNPPTKAIIILIISINNSLSLGRR